MRLTGLLTLLLFLVALSIHAQDTPKLRCVEGAPSTEADYKRWLERDAAYLITAAEKDAFLKLTTNEEREQFVGNFWLRRDPTPDTEENEFQTEYYERIAYANEHFASGIAGWKTDRGKTYIEWGAPDRLEQGSTLAYDETVPYEKWYYRNAPTEFIFVDPTQSKEFRLLKPEDRKNYPHL
jgi:GWxTD domain-containing protein